MGDGRAWGRGRRRRVGTVGGWGCQVFNNSLKRRRRPLACMRTDWTNCAARGPLLESSRTAYGPHVNATVNVKCNDACGRTLSWTPFEWPRHVLNAREGSPGKLEASMCRYYCSKSCQPASLTEHAQHVRAPGQRLRCQVSITAAAACVQPSINIGGIFHQSPSLHLQSGPWIHRHPA